MTKEAAKRKAEKRILWAESAEQQAREIQNQMNKKFENFDFTQPILLGHHSQRRHEKMLSSRDSMMRKIIDLEHKAKNHREKASNLLHFANTNKGDAENARIEKRKMADLTYTVGSKIFDPCFRDGVVTRINKKTFTIIFRSGYVCTRDKSYFA